MAALERYGKNFQRIADSVQTKCKAQVVSYSYRFANRLKRKLEPRYTHLIPIIEGPTIEDVQFWRREEKQKFEEAFVRYG